MDEQQEEDLKQRQWESAHGIDTTSQDLPQTSDQIMAVIFKPTQKEESLYDKYHAIQDYTLTNIERPDEQYALEDDARLVNALLEIRLFNPAHRILSESKQTAALYRARKALQLKELFTRRNIIDRSGEKKKGLI